MSIFPTRILLPPTAPGRHSWLQPPQPTLPTTTEFHLITVAPGNPDPIYHIHEGSLRCETYQQTLEAIKGEAQKVLDEQVQRSKTLEGVLKKPTLGSENVAIRQS